MKNAAFILVVCALVLSFTTPAFSQRNDYVTGFIGAAIANDSELSSPALAGVDVDLSYDIGFSLGIAVGHDFGNYRFEGEFAYQRNEPDELSTSTATGGFVSDVEDDSSSVSLFSVMINGYYDFVNSGQVTPYITGGLGLGSVDIESGDSDENDAVTVFQIGAGINYEINETTSFDLRYRYLVTSDIEIDRNDLDIDFSSHNVLIGFTKRF